MEPDSCPICLSTDPSICASNCYNPWHHGSIVHFPQGAGNALCGTILDDPPSQLAVNLDFVSCPACRYEWLARDAEARMPGMGETFRQSRHVIDQQKIRIEALEEILTLKKEHLELREQHVTLLEERVTLLEERGELTRRLEATVVSQRAAVQEATEIVVATRKKIEHLTLTRELLAAPTPEDPARPRHLTHEELDRWMAQIGDLPAESCLRIALDELRALRGLHAAFDEIDRRYDEINCAVCDKGEGSFFGHCDEHATIVRAWNRARVALCHRNER